MSGLKLAQDRLRKSISGLSASRLKALAARNKGVKRKSADSSDSESEEVKYFAPTLNTNDLLKTKLITQLMLITLIMNWTENLLMDKSRSLVKFITMTKVLSNWFELFHCHTS